ncbi:MAG: ATP-binding protein [Thainema sp.]
MKSTTNLGNRLFPISDIRLNETCATDGSKRNSEEPFGISIQSKIILGYFLSLGIVVSGAIAGVSISNVQQESARRLLEEDIAEELRLPVQIQEQLKIAESEQRLLPSLMNDFEEWQEHKQGFEAAITTAEQAWQELKETYENPEDGIQETNEELEALANLLENYDYLLADYHRQVDAVITNVNPETISLTEQEAIQQLLLAINTPDQVRALDAFEADLNLLIEAVVEEKIEAEAALARANQLKDQITIGSLVLAVGVAIVLSFLISRAITSPLKQTSRVAQQVIDEGNFDLQAPINSNDEVGQLTQTLNLLIQQVKKLLKEQESAKTLLVHNEKMASLGQLVAGVAHEINNPVNFIHGNLCHVQTYANDLLHLIQLYQQECPQPSNALQDEIETIELDFLQADLEKTLTSMQTGTNRIREIVLSLRNFSRLDEIAFKEVDLHEGMDSTLMILQHRFKANSNSPGIKIIKDYDAALPKVECYASQLNQVFMNLLANAVDAFEAQAVNTSPTITIQTSREGENQICVQISDNGPGIPDAVRSRIFNPFFTTKPVGKGTGIGLSISHQIVVEKHGGQLACESSPSQGTTFTITLPIKPSCVLSK